MNEFTDFIISFDYYGSHIAVSDTKEHCYICALKYLYKHHFTIHGLKKTAAGDGHTEGRQCKYTVIGDGGGFKDFFNQEEYRLSDSPYEDAPIVEHIPFLLQEDMEAWSKPYTGYSHEESERYIYASTPSKSLYTFEVSSVFIETPDKPGKYDRTEWGLRKSLYTLKVLNKGEFKLNDKIRN